MTAQFWQGLELGLAVGASVVGLAASRALSRNARHFAWVLAVVCAASLRAQAPPADRVQWSLIEADAAARSLDVYSTEAALARGNRELFLPQAIVAHPMAMAAYSEAMTAGIAYLSFRMLAHHRRLARLLPAIDAGCVAPWAIHNLFLPGASAVPPRRVLPGRY